MNRYEKENAAMKVDGYFLMLSPVAKPNEEFERAKKECLVRPKRQLETVQNLSFEDFAKGKKKTKAWIE